MPQFRYLDPCSSSSAPIGPSGIEAAWIPPDTGFEDVPRPRSIDSGGNYRNYFDALTIAELERSAMDGGGIRTLQGGGPPPPAAGGESGGGNGGESAGSEIMALIGAGFIYAAVDRFVNKDPSDNRQGFALAMIGGGLLYYSRKRSA